MLELFGGIDGDYLLNELPYKEVLARRNARIKRKNKEYEEEAKLREEEMKEQQRVMARNQIMGR